MPIFPPSPRAIGGHPSGDSVAGDAPASFAPLGTHAYNAAVEAGAQLLTGGNGAGPDTGYFYAPAVVTGAAAETDLLREETFGPVAPLVPVASLDEAIEALRREILHFFDRAAADPHACYTHPVFGAISAEDWSRSHFKHTRHHLLQFRLIEE